MNLNNFTIKAQEAVQEAHQIAMAHEQHAIETGHILLGIFQVDENILPFILNKSGVQVPVFRQALEKIVESYPKVTGASEQYLSNDASKAIQKANHHMSQMGDQYISIEHLILGILDGNDQTTRLMKDNGLTLNDLKQAVQELRKGSRVTSSTAEDTYDALGRYARNLNDLVRKGKLDPVIGRDDEIRRILHILSRRTKNNPF